MAMLARASDVHMSTQAGIDLDPGMDDAAPAERLVEALKDHAVFGNSLTKEIMFPALLPSPCRNAVCMSNRCSVHV